MDEFLGARIFKMLQDGYSGASVLLSGGYLMESDKRKKMWPEVVDFPPRLIEALKKGEAMHDANGKELKVGDAVMISATITQLSATEDYCNVNLETERGRRPDGLKEKINAINTGVLVRINYEDLVVPMPLPPEGISPC